MAQANEKVLEYFNKNRPVENDRERALWSRVGNQLARGGVFSMNQLCEMTPAQIEQVRNIGKKSLPVIFAEIEKYRRQLGSNAPAAPEKYSM